MKIVHMTTVHPANDNRIFYKECITLNENGFDVSLIVAGAESKHINGIKIVGFNKISGNRIKRMIKTSFIDLLNVCNNINGDVYHFHDPELIFIGLYLKFIKRKKVIYDIHENTPASILSKPYIKSKMIKKIISKIFDIFEKNTAYCFDALVTARPDISERFKHQNIITLRNFPKLPDLSNINKIDLKKEKPSVIFVGGMTNIRGIYELIEAFENLNEYKLWLLGPITEEDLKKKIESGCKNVRYLGVVEAFEIFSYIKQADIGIITFLPVPNHLNTLATKPFEYMACGKPMIMSDFQYWKNFFKDSALYVDPKNPEDIANKIKYLFNNPSLMKTMGEKNKQLAFNEYNWDKESIKLINLYRNL